MAFIPDKHQEAFKRQPDAPPMSPEEWFRANLEVERIRRRDFYRTLHAQRKIMELEQQLEQLRGRV